MPIKKDLTGLKFNMLTVLEKTNERKNKETMYKCICECGNIKYYNSTDLKNNKSCGCARYKKTDISGSKYGRLTPVKVVDVKHGQSIWKCICDCGNIVNISINALSSGDTKSCGCLQREHYKTTIEHIKKYQIEGTNITLLNSNNIRKNNKSGVTGVSQKKNGKWLAQIVFKRKAYNLGTFENKEDAIKARKTAEDKLHKQFLIEKELY